MPTLRPFLSLTTIAVSFPLALCVAHADGVIGEGKGAPEAELATSLTGAEGCDYDELNQIRDGFAEMATIFQAAVPYEPTGQAAIEFFGNPSTVQNYTDMIAENLQRAANYAKLEGTEGPKNVDIHIRCDDPLGICGLGNKREGSHTAYNIGNEPHVVFCSNYFRLDSLDRRVDRQSQDQTEKEKLTEYYTRATLWARMVMHFSAIGKAVVTKAEPAPPHSPNEWIVTRSEGAMNTSVLAGVLNERPDNSGSKNITTLKYAYGVTRAKLLAVLSTQMPYDATNNAENYALYAQSRYVMREKCFYPNLPIMDFPNEATVLTNENLQDGERVRFAYFDMTDVVARPKGMEVKGKPLPSAASSQGSISIRFTILAMTFSLALSWYGGDRPRNSPTANKCWL